MFFLLILKVNVTPTRLKNLKRRDEAREPTYVLLAPFSPKATVAFEDIPVTKTARRFLLLKNPSECDIKVTAAFIIFLPSF